MSTKRAANNQDSLQLSVDPAVDLVANSPPSLLFTLDQSGTFNATPENQAVLDATGVTLGVSFGSGVRVDSATWTLGSCTISAQQVDCQASSFGNQSGSTLTIGLTGMTVGAQSYSVTMSSNEADANPLNNSVNGTVTISDPADEGGGGSVGLPFLWTLGFLLMLMTRRRQHNI